MAWIAGDLCPGGQSINAMLEHVFLWCRDRRIYGPLSRCTLSGSASLSVQVATFQSEKSIEKTRQISSGPLILALSIFRRGYSANPAVFSCGWRYKTSHTSTESDADGVFGLSLCSLAEIGVMRFRLMLKLARLRTAACIRWRSTT
jgi:hypothetical protein